MSAVKARVAVALGMMTSALSCQLLLNANANPVGSVDASLDGAARLGDESALEASVDASADACDATFCDGFDEGLLGYKWTAVTQIGGYLVLDSKNARTPPNSLLVFAPAKKIDDTTAGLSLTVGPVRTLRCTFSALFEEAPTDAGSGFFADIFLVRMDMAADAGIIRYHVSVATSPSELSIRDDIEELDGGCDPVCPRMRVTSAPLPLHVWIPFEVVMSPLNFVVLVDGVPTILPLATFGPVESVTLSLGLRHYDDQGWTARYDDVRCTY